MINAKDEFLTILKNNEVECCEIYRKNKQYIALPMGYSVADYNKFLVKLDFEYDNHIRRGSIINKGIIWLKNGMWIIRMIQDDPDFECWLLRGKPEVPSYLNPNTQL